jgi:hypothetical protein
VVGQELNGPSFVILDFGSFSWRKNEKESELSLLLGLVEAISLGELR